jgi:hypothetical protein
MSWTGAGKQLIHTGCWRAAWHGAARSFRAVVGNEFVCSSRVRTARAVAAAALPRCNQSVGLTGESPCV